MTKEKMKVYRKRQTALIVGIAIVLIALIAAIVMLFTTGDSKPIKDTTSIASDNSSENGIPVDGGQSSSNGNFYFKEDEITIKVGESYKADVINNTESGDDYIWESSNSSVAIVENGVIIGQSEGSCDITVTINGANHSARLRVYVESDEESEKHEVIEEDGITYIDGIMMASKTYTLPADYDPGINQEALDSFNEMALDAAEEDLNIYIASDYRSYYDQERIYNNYVDRDGKELADTYSSRPGHSDHQTGLAFDLNSIDDSFGDTPESDWVAVNAHKYGFIIRYPDGKEDITGYQYEPWHIRYLGIDKATEIYESGLTVEEFLDVDSAYKD